MLGDTRLARFLHLACLAVFGLAFAVTVLDARALTQPGGGHLGLAAAGVAAMLLAGALDPDAQRVGGMAVDGHNQTDAPSPVGHSVPSSVPANRRRTAR